MKIRRAPVASEGLVFIGAFAFLAWAAAIAGLTLISLVLAAVCVLNIFFFRDPDRVVPEEEDIVLSPADGRVILIEDAHEGDFLDSTQRRISISLALYDCHVNRAPVSGTVRGVKYTPGKFRIAHMPELIYTEEMKKASGDNERNSLLIEDGEGRKTVVYQIAGFLARRIVCYATEGTEFKKGERYGMIKFGSRLDVYLPEGFAVNTEVGDRVTAGESIIARLERQD